MLLLAFNLAGCGSIAEKVTDRMADMPGIGLPSGAPERSATPVVYPAVHDMPPQRPAGLLNEAEQQKLEADLTQARDRQQAQAGTKPPEAPTKKKAQPAGASPAAPAAPPASGRSIY